MTNVSISLKAKNAERLDDLAKTLDRPRSWVVNDAIAQYLEHHDWMDRETDAAIADIDAGAPMVSHDDVMTRMQQRRKARHS